MCFKKGLFAFIHWYNTLSRAQNSYFGVTRCSCNADIMKVTPWDELFLPQSEQNHDSFEPNEGFDKEKNKEK
jgi:hypothetical protein